MPPGSSARRSFWALAVYTCLTLSAVPDPFSSYAALGLEVCRQLDMPACLLFNECAYIEWVLQTIDLGYSLVMFTDETLDFEAQITQVRQVVVPSSWGGGGRRG